MDYRIDVFTPAGVKVAEVTDYLELAYSKRVNEPGLLSFVLYGDHGIISQLEDKSQVVVYRRNNAMGLDWTADFYGLLRRFEYRYGEREVFIATCPGILSMLGWRIVAWYAGTNNRSDFSSAKAETIMKTLVTYNAGSGATTANGRLRNGQITGIVTETDGGRGNTINLGCAWANLLTTLQKVATIGGGDFDLVKTGAAQWEFRFYPGQLGVDRSSYLMFSLERGNMANPRYDDNRQEWATVAIVAGSGEESSRQTAIRTSSDYGSSDDYEVFVDGRNAPDSLNSMGDKALYETRRNVKFEFDILQMPSCYYGLHYGLGDKVAAKYRGYEAMLKIVGIGISFKDGVEDVVVEMSYVG